MEYCPARVPPRASRRLLGNALKASRDGAAFRIESRFAACLSSPWNAATNAPPANRAVRRSLYPRIMSARVCRDLTPDVKRHCLRIAASDRVTVRPQTQGFSGSPRSRRPVWRSRLAAPFPLALGYPVVLQQALNLSAQHRRIGLDDVPNQSVVHVSVSVNQEMAEGNDALVATDAGGGQSRFSSPRSSAVTTASVRLRAPSLAMTLAT